MTVETERKPRTAQSLRWWFAVPFAALGGFALDAATPAINWWPAALIGVVLIIASVWQQRARTGLLIGLIAGAAFWMPHIHWLTLYLGPVPWLALSGVMVFWFGLFGAVAALATRGLAKLPFSAPVLILVQSLTIAGLWVAREQLQSTWPYGGFAWGRIAITQAEGPLVNLVSWLGFAGLSGLIVFACALVIAIVAHSKVAVPRKAIAVMLVGLFLAGLSSVPAAEVKQTSTLRIAAAQGNSKSAIFDDRENGDVIRDHIVATDVLLDELEIQGRTCRPDHLA